MGYTPFFAGSGLRKATPKGQKEMKEIISADTPGMRMTRGALSGPLKAINETVEFFDDIYDSWQGNPYDNNDLIDLKSIGLEQPGDKEDWIYTVPQGITQFLLPMGLASKGLKGTISNPWVRNAVAGFITDYIVQDPFEENLFNLLDKHPNLSSPVTELLKAKTQEEIIAAEGRLRQASSGLIFGEALTVFGMTIKGIRKSPEISKRILRRLLDNPNVDLVYALDEDLDKVLFKGFEKLSPDAQKVLRAVESGNVKKLSKQEIINSIKEISEKHPEKLTPKLKKTLGIEDTQKVDVSGGGGGAKKPPSGPSADIPPVNPDDAKVQTTFNPKFLGPPDVGEIILKNAETIKNLDAEGKWPLKRSFLDISKVAEESLPKEVIEAARLFNVRYGRGGETDLPATLVAMNRLMNKTAENLYQISISLDQSLATGNKETFLELKEQLVYEARILDGLITLNKPLKTIPAQTLAANKISGSTSTTSASIEDLASRSPTEKAVDQNVNLRATVEGVDDSKVIEQTGYSLQNILDLAEKGDKAALKKLRIITKKLQAAAGNPEALLKMNSKSPLMKGLDISNEIFINSILSGPETHAVNVLSTALNTIVRPIDQMVGSAVIGDTTGMARGGKELMYLINSFQDSIRGAYQSFRIENNIIDPGAMVQDSARFNVRMDGDGSLANIINYFGTAQRLPSRLLLAEDELFKQLNFRAYVKASAWENGVRKGLKGQKLQDYITNQFKQTMEIVETGSMANTKNISVAELYEKAKLYASETTFTQDLGQDTFGKKIQGVSSNPVGRMIFPFVRTPINIFKAQVRRTPGVNLLLQDYRQALKSTDPSVVAKARGEMIVGGMFWSSTLMLSKAIDDDFSELAMTGGGPSNIDQLNQKRATGWQPYSFRFLKKDENGEVIMGVDGRPQYKYVSFKRLDPWASFLMMSADHAAITGKLSNQDRDDFTVAASVAMGRNITNKTYLQGVTEITAVMQNPRKFEDWLARRMAATVNPYSSLSRSINKQITKNIPDKKIKAGDLIKRDASGDVIYGPDGNIKENMYILRKFHNELIATSPFGDGDLPPLRNFITGKIVEYPVGYGPDEFSFMNPFKETNSVNHAVLTNLVNIGARIEQPSDILPFGKRLDGSPILSGVKLDSHQYADYVEEIAFVKINGVPLVRALYNKMQQKEIKVLLSQAKGENINSDNMNISVEVQEIARGKLETIFKNIISKYKKAGKLKFLEKNPKLALEYEKQKRQIKQVFSESALDALQRMN